MSKLEIKDFLFLIPARKNSKGIKNKNFLKN
jgi:CMP-N-acetylneuraminic acid synthetase